MRGWRDGRRVIAFHLTPKIFFGTLAMRSSVTSCRSVKPASAAARERDKTMSPPSCVSEGRPPVLGSICLNSSPSAIQFIHTSMNSNDAASQFVPITAQENGISTLYRFFSYPLPEV